MDGYLSGEQSGLNKKIGAVTLLVLMSLAVALTPIAIVSGQNSLGVEILQVAPVTSSSIVTGQSQYNGTAGQAFNLQGTIYYSNSSYQIIFGTNVVATGISAGYYVNANFTVPYIPGGSYDLTLRDVKLNVNSTGTTPESFLVLNWLLHKCSPFTNTGRKQCSIDCQCHRRESKRRLRCECFRCTSKPT